MTTKWLKPNNGKLSNIIKDSCDQQKSICVSQLCIETEEAQLESNSNSELKTNSDHNKQVSKKATLKTSLY